MTLHEQIIIAYNTYIKETEKFEKQQIKVSAVRARQALQDLNKLTKERRKEIQEQKGEM